MPGPCHSHRHEEETPCTPCPEAPLDLLEQREGNAAAQDLMSGAGPEASMLDDALLYCGCPCTAEADDSDTLSPLLPPTMQALAATGVYERETERFGDGPLLDPRMADLIPATTGAGVLGDIGMGNAPGLGQGPASNTMTALNAGITFVTYDPAVHGPMSWLERAGVTAIDTLFAANPATAAFAVVDTALGGQATGMMNAGVSASFAVVDSLMRWDLDSMDRWNDAALSGQHGEVIQSIAAGSDAVGDAFADVAADLNEDDLVRDSVDRLGERGLAAMADDDRVQMIRAMLDGATGDEDEMGIIQVLEASVRNGDLVTIVDRVDAHLIGENIDGDEEEPFLRLMRNEYIPNAPRASIEELLEKCADGSTDDWEETIIYDVFLRREGIDGRALIRSFGDGSRSEGLSRIESELESDQWDWFRAYYGIPD